MKFLFLCGLSALALSMNVYASSSGTRGGGDLCEDRIQNIRDDIKSWIFAGGEKGLSLPSTLNPNQYARQMLAAISSAKIECVKPGDAGYPLYIDGTPKVCAFDLKSAQITCDYSTFMDKQTMSESEQYVLIHHELAGLAKLENPSGDVSSYTLSNQISGFLVDTVVKKLAIKPQNTSEHISDRAKIRNFIIAANRYLTGFSWDCLMTSSVGGPAGERLSLDDLLAATNLVIIIGGPQPTMSFVSDGAPGTNLKFFVNVILSSDQSALSAVRLETQLYTQKYIGDLKDKGYVTTSDEKCLASPTINQ